MKQQRVDVLSKVYCDRKVGYCLNERVPGVKCAPLLIGHVIDACVGDNAGAGKDGRGGVRSFIVAGLVCCPGYAAILFRARPRETSKSAEI